MSNEIITVTSAEPTELERLFGTTIAEYGNKFGIFFENFLGEGATPEDILHEAEECITYNMTARARHEMRQIRIREKKQITVQYFYHHRHIIEGERK